MAYTPELSLGSSSTLRRLAWALEIPMTVAIEEVFAFLPTVVSSERICERCKDKTRCENCVFNDKERERDGKNILDSISRNKVPDRIGKRGYQENRFGIP